MVGRCSSSLPLSSTVIHQTSSLGMYTYMVVHVAMVTHCSTYKHQVVPYLVSTCDEQTLSALASDVLATPFPDLLRESVSVSMVLILTSYSEQRDSVEAGPSEDGRQAATNSHTLLTSALTEEVCVAISPSKSSFSLSLPASPSLPLPLPP